MQWGEIARAQGGAITRAQLRTAGLGGHAIDHLLATQALHACTPGVYGVRGAPDTWHSRLWTAVLTTRGIVGFGTAAHLWGVDDDVPPRVDVIVGHERRVTIPDGVRVHRVFAPARAIVRRDGLPMTSRSWTLLDHLGRLSPERAYRLADRALQREWITATDLRRRLRDYPGRRGNRVLRAIEARCGDGAAAESERVLHRLLRRAGVAHWEPNYPIWIDGVLIAVVDVALPKMRIAVEIDGWAYHSDVDRFQRDRQRQNALVSLGWTVLRFTWWDLTQRPGYVIATIRGQVARAG